MDIGRQRLKSFEEDDFRVAIRLGHGRGVVLEVDVRRAVIVRHNGRAGFGGGIGEDTRRVAEVETFRIGGYWRGCTFWC